jgi:hypothetical protein
MAVRSNQWEQVSERFEALADHLRGHFDEVGTEASAERTVFERSIRGLLAALEDGFGAAGKAVRDPVLRDDVKSVATSVREALLSTLETAGDQVRERLSPTSTAAEPPPAKRAPATKATARKVAAKPAAGKPTPRKRAAS